ncbi:dephospho-CoA kinase [Streptococcaceae bacterium ESL0687]|nr:dephospho-CoA kinase [Streptococcaceae bacterium ESL0687]
MTNVIGLTGGIASGKSTVTNFLRDKGYQVIDADQVVHDLQKKGQPLYQIIEKELGPSFIQEDGELDRKKIASYVFADKKLLEKISLIQNKVIRESLAQKRRELLQADFRKNKGQGIIFMDIPLLFEGKYDYFDQVWLVYVPQEIQLARLMKRNNLSAAEAQKRIDSQMPLEEKRELADRIIDNSTTREATKEQVENLLEALLADKK